MKTIVSVALLCAVAVFGSAAFTQAANPAASTTVPVSATIFGTFYPGQGWVGYALVQFGEADPLWASFVDANTGLITKSNGIAGTETITLTFVDGSGGFAIFGRFHSNVTTAPQLGHFHETGTIANGWGRYSAVAGAVSVQGLAVMPFPPPPSGPSSTPWVSEVHGSISGLAP